MVPSPQYQIQQEAIEYQYVQHIVQQFYWDLVIWPTCPPLGFKCSGYYFLFITFQFSNRSCVLLYWFVRSAHTSKRKNIPHNNSTLFFPLLSYEREPSIVLVISTGIQATPSLSHYNNPSTILPYKGNEAPPTPKPGDWCCFVFYKSDLNNWSFYILLFSFRSKSDRKNNTSLVLTKQ